MCKYKEAKLAQFAETSDDQVVSGACQGANCCKITNWHHWPAKWPAKSGLVNFNRGDVWNITGSAFQTTIWQHWPAKWPAKIGMVNSMCADVGNRKSCLKYSRGLVNRMRGTDVWNITCSVWKQLCWWTLNNSNIEMFSFQKGKMLACSINRL